MSPDQKQKEFEASNREMNQVSGYIAILVLVVTAVGAILTWIYQNIVTILLVIIGLYLLYHFTKLYMRKMEK